MRSRGFTLIELLVAISVMALIAVLSWRGLDGMARAQAQTQQRSDEVLTLQAGLSQWTADLEALVKLPGQNAIDWDGRVLRLTRRSSVAADEGVLVTAWARRLADGGGQWLRWQSPPLRTRGQLQEAWLKAAAWAQNPSDEEKRREVAITPLDEWQVFYFRGDAWTNPLSSDAGGLAVGIAASLPAGSATAVATAVIPDGVRLSLSLPQGQTLGGKILLDWVRPTVGGGKS